MKHHVLYVHDKARNERRPLASREDGDPNMADDFAVLRQDAIREARARGAERPEFETVIEVGGEPVAEPVAELVVEEAGKPVAKKTKEA